MTDALNDFEKTKYRPLSRPYWFVLAVLAVAILWTAGLVVVQTQERHKLYNDIVVMKREYRAMHTEEQALLIQQQKFSATPVVARRASEELMMYYPDDKHRKVITPPNYGVLPSANAKPSN